MAEADNPPPAAPAPTAPTAATPAAAALDVASATAPQPAQQAKPESPPGPDDVVTVKVGGKAGALEGKRVIARGAGRDSHPMGSGRKDRR